MKAEADKTESSKSRAVAGAVAVQQYKGESEELFADRRQEAAAQREHAGKADNSPQAGKIAQMQAMANGVETVQKVEDEEKEKEGPAQAKFESVQRVTKEEEIQTKGAIAQKKETQPPKNTGLPDTLKSGIENLSGFSMDDVKVHYNSAKPAQLQAHAFAQGTDIHMAPGQEKHLPHEAWHVVQQKQGRVQPTKQLKGKVNVNDDAGLEKEADLMGDKALITRNNTEAPGTMKHGSSRVIQRAYKEGEEWFRSDIESKQPYSTEEEAKKAETDSEQNTSNSFEAYSQSGLNQDDDAERYKHGQEEPGLLSVLKDKASSAAGTAKNKAVSGATTVKEKTLSAAAASKEAAGKGENKALAANLTGIAAATTNTVLNPASAVMTTAAETGGGIAKAVEATTGAISNYGQIAPATSAALAAVNLPRDVRKSVRAGKRADKVKEVMKSEGTQDVFGSNYNAKKAASLEYMAKQNKRKKENDAVAATLDAAVVGTGVATAATGGAAAPGFLAASLAKMAQTVKGPAKAIVKIVLKSKGKVREAQAKNIYELVQEKDKDMINILSSPEWHVIGDRYSLEDFNDPEKKKGVIKYIMEKCKPRS